MKFSKAQTWIIRPKSWRAKPQPHKPQATLVEDTVISLRRVDLDMSFCLHY